MGFGNTAVIRFINGNAAAHGPYDMPRPQCAGSNLDQKNVLHPCLDNGQQVTIDGENNLDEAFLEWIAHGIKYDLVERLFPCLGGCHTKVPLASFSFSMSFSWFHYSFAHPNAMP